MKIAVVGSGVMGLSAAHEVMRRGAGSLTLYEDKEHKPASRCAGGMLAPYAEADSLDADLQQAALDYSLNFWRKKTRALGTYFADNGTYIVAHPQDEPYLKRFQSYLSQGCYETVQEHPLSGRFASALYIKDEAHMNVQETLHAMRQSIEAEFKGTYDEAEAGQYELVIDCRGVHAKQASLRWIKGERLLLHAPDLKLQHCVRMMHPRYPLYIVPQGKDHYVVGATMIEDSKDEHFTLRSALEMMTAFSSLGTQVLESNIVNMETGFRPAYPSQRPAVKRQGNIVSCNGLYRHGFLLAPLMAKEVFQPTGLFEKEEERILETVH